MATNIPALNVTTKSYQRSSPSLLVADLDDDNNRPRHKRSASSPHSFSFIFQRLTVDTRASSSSHHQQLLLKTSPAKRPLKRLPGALPHKMDQEVSGQTGHDASKEAARRAIQNDHPHPPKRPLPPSRNTSYSKRHASFDSPREVPLPSPSAQLSSYFPLFSNTSSHARTSSLSSQGPGTDSSSTTVTTDEYPVFDQGSQSDTDSGDDSLPSAPPSPRTEHRHSHGAAMHSPKHMTGLTETNPYSEQITPHSRDHHSISPETARSRVQPMQTSQTTIAPIFPWTRPYSLPQNHSNSFGPTDPNPAPAPAKQTWPDRSSSASLPLPMQTPYFTLPQRDAQDALQEDQEMKGPWEGDAAPSERRGHAGGDSGPSPPMTATMLATTSSLPSPPALHRLDPLAASIPSAALGPVHPMSRSVAASSRSSYPEPAAPMIFSPPPPPSGSTTRPHAPYEPFLCHNPVAEDRHSITVETATNEYRLVVRLPGFSRDAITLATRRRRILHIVADSWAPGGGHFERRVSFGYDADLSQVRAEFDGETLTVIIPRRISPMAVYS